MTQKKTVIKKKLQNETIAITPCDVCEYGTNDDKYTVEFIDGICEFCLKNNKSNEYYEKELIE